MSLRGVSCGLGFPQLKVNKKKPPILRRHGSMSSMISLIMPTRGRPQLAALALDCAIRQDYDPVSLEIVIFDDEDEPSFSDPPATRYKRVVRYFRNPRDHFRSLGDKRNALCEESLGDIIAHFDSDDLSATNRISTQIQSLSDLGKSISGFHTLPFYDLLTGQAYCYHLNKAYALGTSLAYRREFWRKNPFPSIDIGEDLPYTAVNREHRISACGRDMMVALLHDGNMSSRNQAHIHSSIFPKIATDTLPGWFQDIKSRWREAEDCDKVTEISNGLFTTKQSNGP